MKDRVRTSFFYLAGYLTFGGLGLFAAPRFALKLLGSNGEYGEVFPRVAGMIMLGLAAVVVQIIRHHLKVLYTTTLAIRTFFVISLIGLFVRTKDPFFLVLVGIIVLGMAFTSTALLLDRKAASTAPAK